MQHFVVQLYKTWTCKPAVVELFKYATSSSSAFLIIYYRNGSFNQYAYLIPMLSCFMT